MLLYHTQVGLAVDDIKGIQEAAVLKRLALQVRSMTSSVFHLGRGVNMLIQDCTFAVIRWFDFVAGRLAVLHT